MVNIEESGFFQQLTAQQVNSDGSVRLLHNSVNGWSQLYLADRHGRFRMLKTLKPEYRGNPLYEELLRKEFEIGYTLSHPGICEIYGFHKSDEFGNCIEMEWIDGVNLSDFIQNGRISRKLAMKLFSQICNAVQYIHSRQIVHRDLKPSNIMVTHNGQNIKIIDFGLSDSDSFSILKAPAGTLSFAAPELTEGKECNHRTDIYSLGRILEMLGISCPRTAGRCTKNNPEDRFMEPSQILGSLKREKLIRKLLLCIPIAILVIGVIFIVNAAPGYDDPATVPDTQYVSKPDTTMIYNADIIDELFRQATDMVVSAESQN